MLVAQEFTSSEVVVNSEGEALFEMNQAEYVIIYDDKEFTCEEVETYINFVFRGNGPQDVKTDKLVLMEKSSYETLRKLIRANYELKSKDVD